MPAPAPTFRFPRWLELWRLVPLVGTMLLGFVAMDRLLAEMHRAMCPANTFLSAPTQIGHIVFTIAPMFAAIPVAFLVANLMEFIVRELMSWSDWAGFIKSSRWMLFATGVLLAAATPLMLASAFSYFCLSDAGITARPSVFHSARQYQWSDVQSVVADCFHQGRTNRDSYSLVLPDLRLDIADRRQEFIAAFPIIKEKLRKAGVTFRSEHLADCPEQLRSIFATRP